MALWRKGAIARPVWANRGCGYELHVFAAAPEERALRRVRTDREREEEARRLLEIAAEEEDDFPRSGPPRVEDRALCGALLHVSQPGGLLFAREDTEKFFEHPYTELGERRTGAVWCRDCLSAVGLCVPAGGGFVSQMIRDLERALARPMKRGKRDWVVSPRLVGAAKR